MGEREQSVCMCEGSVRKGSERRQGEEQLTWEMGPRPRDPVPRAGLLQQHFRAWSQLRPVCSGTVGFAGNSCHLGSRRQKWSNQEQTLLFPSFLNRGEAASLSFLYH